MRTALVSEGELMGRFARIRWGIGLGLVLAACGGDDATSVCAPGATQVCVCAGGLSGAQACRDDGSGFGVCECAGVDAGPGPVDAGMPTSDAGSPGCDVRVGEEALEDSCGGGDLCICPPVSCSELGCSVCATPGTCEAATPRRFRIVPIEAAVPTTSPSGDAWDPGGGAPDLYARVSVDGSTILASTAVGSDSFTVSWSGAFADATLVAGSRVLIEVFDRDDLDADDGAFVCEWPVTAELLRGRILFCEGELGSLLATVLPL
jgi:hypothetical protein